MNRYLDFVKRSEHALRYAGEGRMPRRTISTFSCDIARPISRVTRSMARSKAGRFAGVSPNTSAKRGYWVPVAEQGNDQLARYQERLEQVMAAAREGVERQAPEVLEKLAATARNVAQRLDDMARDARQKQAEKQPSPAPTGTSEREPEPPDDP
jgi:hypothetical protein